MEYLYVRASTNSDRQDLSRQLRFGRQHNISDENVFKEYASGKNLERKELKRLLAILKENDTVYVSEISRLSRSLKGLLELVDFAKDKRIRFCFGDNFTLDCRGKWSIMTEMQLLTFGLIAEMQRLMIVDSVLDGLATAKEQGRIGGQPRLTPERICEKNPQFFKYYAQWKNREISRKELHLLSEISRNTCTYWIKVIEGNNSQ